MARRKRLTPPESGQIAAPGRAPEIKTAGSGPAPIAQVAGDVAGRAALEEVSAAMQIARADGRIIERLPLEAIDEAYLVRDRLEQDADEMEALETSLAARGQQTAIEVTRLPGPQERYGLISGWRRLTALRRLHARTQEPRFASIKALVVAPDTAQAAYLSMVEENEIRVNLSFYERARIAHRALHEGLFPTQRAALQGLFGSTTRPRRSKIGSFIPLVEALDDVLRHPTAISERLGLGLSREMLRDPDFVSVLRNRLESAPERTAGEEVAILARALEAAAPSPEPTPTPAPAPDPVPGHAPDATPAAPAPDAYPAPRPESETVAPGLTLTWWAHGDKVQISGPAVDAGFFLELKAWLESRR